MTYQKALELMKRHYKRFVWFGLSTDKYALMCALDALGKQISKKLNSNGLCSCGYLPLTNKGTRLKYCSNCGQAIDWRHKE